jgi:putative ABC transport system permease protein
MDDLRQDLRFALRQLWKRPAFSVIALTMLALGIGANTAIFSVVHTVLLQPLPFPQAEEVLQIWESRLEQGRERTSFAPANFWDFRDMSQAFQDLGAFRFTQVNLTGLGNPERLQAGRVTAGFFGQILGVRPVIGRAFAPGEDQLGGENRVVMLGYDFWQDRFGGDRGVLNTTLLLDGEGHAVVGVLPPGRPWLDQGEVFLPLVPSPDDARGSWELAVIGRLRDGTTPEAGLADLQRVAARLEELYPEINAGIGVAIAPAEEWIADGDLRRALWLLLGAVGFLLMIACVNLANLLLAQATGRARETAIKAAVGAGKGRLLRQTLTEALLLALLGAGLGLLLALWGLDAVRAFDPGGIPRLGEVSINRWVLAFTLGAGVLTGIVTGIVPALQASGSDAAQTLRSGAQSIAGNLAQKRLRGALVSAELALSMALLIGAGLLIRSFSELLSVDRGFETENRLVVSVSLPPAYAGEQMEMFLQGFLEQTLQIPTVQAVGAVSGRPISGGSTGLGIARPEEPEPEGGVPWATWRLVTPGYFNAMGIPLVRGRFLDERDRIDAMGEAPLPIVISQRVADLLWPEQDAIGKVAVLWAGQNDQPGEVIGVAGNMRERGLDSDPTLAVYLPYSGADWPPTFVFHTAGEPTVIVPAVREVLGRLDPNLPLSGIQTMEEIVGSSLASRRFIMSLVGLFATVSLLLAMAGVYGVQAYTVTRQTSEIGIRVAMGAALPRIVRGIVFEAMKPAVLGIGLGLGGAFFISRLMASLLFQVEASDPYTYLGVGVLLMVTALLSSWLPARRASKVDPVIAFRTE